MKLRLNPTLRRCLLASFCAVFTLFSAAQAGTLHSQVTMQTYTDFGQNVARYSVSGVNELLSSIRERDKGVVLTYTGGLPPYTLQHPMISFESQGDNGAYAAIGYNFIATVQHNGVQNPTFTARYIGDTDSLHYYGIEYRDSANFLLTPSVDYKITRLSKIVTDVETSALYTGVPQVGDMIYRAGSGTMTVRNIDGTINSLSGAYQYVTGGITSLVGAFYTDNRPAGDDSMRTTVRFDYTRAGINSSTPLPFNGDGGDSGSPLWVWNGTTQRYEYFAAAQAVNRTDGAGTETYCFGATQWSQDSMDAYSQTVNLAEGNTGYAYVSGNMQQGESITEDVYKKKDNVDIYQYTRVGEQWYAHVTDTAGNVLATYNGVQNGVSTWSSLTTLKDHADWYSYNNTFLNANERGTDGKMSIATLYRTENLAFTSDKAQNTVVIDAQGVDLGVGYAQFSRTGEGAVSYTVSGGAFEHAGYVVDEGVSVHLSLQNGNADNMREWRKTGKGDLYLEGSGNNEIFLNVGGSGTTYLSETDGYAAYNVLAGSGATVVLKQKDNGDADINQIARDFTFGANGGTLDFNGNAEMDWYRTTTDAAADGFSINSLSEDAYITNNAAGSLVKLVYKESGNTAYKGSFTDADAGGAVKVVYDAGADSKLVLNSIHTDLSHQADSGFEVTSGTVELAGTNTLHGMGSATGRNTDRYFNAADWHYADSAMNVEVAENATFILGSHARLTGNVTVESGGKLIIKEGTQNRYEYIEGGYALEDTESDFYTPFYGLKGDITLNNGAFLEFRYGEDVTTHNTYSGSISGSGSMLIDLGTNGAVLTLGGDNRQFAPEKIQAVSGGIIAEGTKALGTGSHMLHLQDKAWLGVKGAAAAEILPYITADSAGVLALTQNEEQQLGLGDFARLIIGALEGTSIEYGTFGTAETLTSRDNCWQLGGGGGELVVNFALKNGDGTLVLGNEYTTGSVTLTNTDNSFKEIVFAGKVTLNYTNASALGGATIDLGYTNRIMGSEHLMSLLPETADGVMLMDNMANLNVDMRGHTALNLGSVGHTVYTGHITLADKADYRFGGISGTLEMTQKLSGAHNLIVDGQTFSGGILALQTPVSLTGEVTVMGYDAEKTAQTAWGGNITLRLDAEDALTSAAAVTLKDGGILDISGLNQTVHNLNTEDGSLITDTAPGHLGALTVVQNSDGSLGGVTDVSRLIKTGSGVLHISGTSTTQRYDVQEGTLRVTDKNAMAEIITVRGGATLQTGGMSTSASALHLEDGAVLSIDNGSTLTLTSLPLLHDGETATVKGNLTFNINEDMRMQGTLRMDGSATNGEARLALSGTNTSDVYRREFNHIDVADGTNLTISQDVKSMPAQFVIHQLSGSGNVQWQGGNYHEETSAYYILDGANSFSGNLKLVDNTGYTGRAYGNFFVLQHDEAAAQAQLQLKGWTSTTGVLVLGIDTENARVQGLETTDNTGAQVLMIAGSTSNGTTEAPVSTRQATLTVTGSGNKTYSGNVAGGDNGNGLSLVMQGSGTQTFDGNNVVFNQVSAQSGNLNLTAKNLDIRDTAEIYRGAILNLGSNYALTEGHTLAVGGSSETPYAAILTSNLQLAGGSLRFDAAALNTTFYTLETGALSKAQGVTELTVQFTNTSYLKDGITYILAGGDWGSLGLTYNATGMEYMQAEFATMPSLGWLTVQFSIADGNTIWDGTSGSNMWSSSRFGQHGAVATSGENLIFNDSAAWHQVQINGALDYSGDSLIFDTARQYTLTAGGDNSLTTGDVHNVGSGTTSLAGNISVAAGKTVTVDNGTLVLENSAAVAEAGMVSGTGTLHLNDAEGTTAIGSNIGELGTLIMDGGATYTLNGATNLGHDTVLRSGSQATVSLGDFSFDGRHADFEGMVTANQLNISAGRVRFGGGLSATGVSVTGGQSEVSGENTIGNLTITGGTLHSEGELTAGTVNIDGGTVTLNGNSTIGDGASGNYDLIVNRGTLNLNGNTVINGDMQLGNNAAGTAKAVVSIGAGGSLSVNKLNSAWGFELLTVDGVLNADSINLSTGTTNTINGGGVINTTLLTGTNNGNYKFSGVRLNIGSRGINGERPITFSDMVLGATADWTAARNFTLGGSVTFNTALYDKQTAQDTENGATITINGALQASGSVELRKIGNGTLKLNGNSAGFLGNVMVEAGTLELADNGILAQAANIITLQGGSLKFNSALVLNHSAILNYGSILYGDAAYYELTEEQLISGGSYLLATGNGSISGLSEASFRHHNRDIAQYAEGLTVDLRQTDGNTVLTISGTPLLNRTITWDGSDSRWDLAQTANWRTEDGQRTKAYGADRLVFNGSGSSTVSVAPGVYARSYSIESGSYTFSGMNNVESGATLNIAAGAAASVDSLASFPTVELGGELTLRLSGNSTLQTSINPDGETRGSLRTEGSGTLTVSDTGVLKTQLARVSDITATNGTQITLGADRMTLDADHYAASLTADGGTLNISVIQNDMRTFDGNLTVINGGTLRKADGGITFTGAVTLGASATDSVTLTGNWGKGGIVLDGAVSGNGQANITSQGYGNPQKVTLNNNTNDFCGTYCVASNTQLIINADGAVQSASAQLEGGTLVMGSENITLVNLTGSNSGSAVIKGTQTDAATLTLTGAAGSYSGSIDTGISIIKQGDDSFEFTKTAALDVDSFTLGGGSLQLTGNNSKTKRIGTLKLLQDGALVTQYGADSPTTVRLDIGTLCMNRTATLQEKNHAGYMRLGTLTLSEGTQNATLTLQNAAASEIVSIYELGDANAKAGDFRGNIILSSSDIGGYRSATAVLNNTDIAQHAVITLGSTVSTTAKLGLGLNAAEVNIAGLASELGNRAFVYGGTTSTQTNSKNTENLFTGDTGVRKLNINTAADTAYSFNGVVGKGISLVKTGAGTQTLTGDSTAFNGGIAVEEGMLTLGGDAVNMLTTATGDITVSKGATLNINITNANDIPLASITSCAGTLRLTNSGSDNISLSGKAMDASWLTGRLELAGGTNQLRFQSNNFNNLGDGVVIVIDKRAQYWGTGQNFVADNDFELHADSGNRSGSGTYEGFGSIRDVSTFNGTVTIDGNALISLHLAGTITFNSAIKGLSGGNGNDTLSLGCFYISSSNQSYMLSEGADASELANMTLLNTANNKGVTVQVNGNKGLAQNVNFEAGCGSRNVININADNSIKNLNSNAGDGVVNITHGHTLQLQNGAGFGGVINVGSTAVKAAEGKVTHIDGEMTLSADSDTESTIKGNGSTVIADSLIDLNAQTTLHLQDVVLADTTRLTDDPGATVDMSNVTVQAKVGSNLSEGSATTLAAGTTLTQFGEGGKQQTLAQNEACTAYTLNSIENVSLKGSSMTIELSNLTYEELLGLDTPWVGITLANSAAFDTNSALEVYLSVVGGRDNDMIYTMLGYYSGSTSNAVYFNLGEAVPEPTTGTLSLLALAALCARRRRKA